MAELEIVSAPEQWHALVALSRERPVWLMKHSTSCGISKAARREFEHFVAGRPAAEPARFALVEVQAARELCRRIAEQTGVRHESPQVLLLRDGAVTWHASHWKIDTASLAEAAGPL